MHGHVCACACMCAWFVLPLLLSRCLPLMPSLLHRFTLPDTWDAEACPWQSLGAAIFATRTTHTQTNTDQQHGHTTRSLFASVLPVPCHPMDYRASKASERARPRASVLSHDIHNLAKLGPSRCNVYGMESSRSHLDVEPFS